MAPGEDFIDVLYGGDEMQGMGGMSGGGGSQFTGLQKLMARKRLLRGVSRPSWKSFLPKGGVPLGAMGGTGPSAPSFKPPSGGGGGGMGGMNM